MKPEVCQFLEDNKIKYILHKHKPVYTCEEAAQHCSMVKGMHCKNLFLKDKKSADFFLIMMPAEKRADLKKISIITNSKHITFGKPEELKTLLNLEPGSVSPFGLLNDKQNIIKVYIDNDLWQSDKVSFHPNQNDETLELEKEMFHEIINKIGNNYEIIEL